MMNETNFTEKVLKAFKNIINEIEKGSSEFEVRRTFDELFLRSVLGYERRDIKWEKKGLIYNIEVPKSDDVLNEIVRWDKTKIEEEIMRLEDEIDGLVYEIYGVTDNERKIVKTVIDMGWQSPKE
jgi:hypothetical protein